MRGRTITAGTLLATAAMSSAAGAQLTLGANSRGYVSANQTFTNPSCAAGAFGANVGRAPTFVGGNARIDCAQAGWNGQAVIESEARRLRSVTRVAVTQPGGLDLNTLPNSGPQFLGLAALSRAIFLDEMFIDPNGAIPDSARFNFTLSGFLDNSAGANTVAQPTANFSMAWDTRDGPGFTQRLVMAPGEYAFAFAITPAMVGRPISFSIALQTFAILSPTSATPVISGEAITDYGNTLVLNRLQYLRAAPGGGAGTDVTAAVQARYATNADYATTLATVPEPGTWALLGTGLLAVGGAARRRARAQG